MDRPFRPWIRRLARGSLALSIALAASAVVAEVVVRGVLFGGWFPEVAAAERLRNPRRYAHFNADAYQALQHVLGAEGLRPEPNVHDRRLGWLTRLISPGTYAHVAGGARGDRRPVLLFGDSFAQGVTEPSKQFQALFEGTELAREMQLVNYGVGGYGLDQICLLAELAVPQWIERDPIVLMSLLVDDDIDRCRLTIRSWPKPRYRMVDGRPVLAVSEVPTTAEYMAADPLGRTLWSWQLLVHHELLPRRMAEVLCGERAGEDEARALGRALLERNVAMLRELGVPFGYVLFHSLRTYERPELLGWREQLVIEVLERERVPYVLSRLSLIEHQRAHGGSTPDYFRVEGLSRNHYNARGNRVVLEPMVELVERLAAE